MALDPNWHRDYNWQYSAGLQQEFFSGITLNVNWFRHSTYQAALVMNYSALPLSDWTPATINNPLNGTPITVYNLNSSIKSLPAASLRETNAPQSLVRDVYSGYEFQVSGRLKRGIYFQFGYTIERELNRNCDLNVSVSSPLQDPNNLRYLRLVWRYSLSFGGINVAEPGHYAVAAVGQQLCRQRGHSSPVGHRRRAVFHQQQLSGAVLQRREQQRHGVQDVNNGYLPRTIAISSAKTSVYPNGCVGAAAGGQRLHG